MFEKLQIGEKIHDAPGQPRTCSHPIYARTLTGVIATDYLVRSKLKSAITTKYSITFSKLFEYSYSA